MTFIKTPVKGMAEHLPKDMALREYVASYASVMTDAAERPFSLP